MRVTGISQIKIGNESLQRIDYTGCEGLADWALLRVPEDGKDWLVCIHGHGSNGDQLYVREDVRDLWLPEFVRLGFGVLTPNLRGNAWMCKSAAQDITDLLDFLREEWEAERFIFASGSMGGTSNLIYASLHPENVDAVVALGAASNLASYHNWCRQRNQGVIAEIADAIEQAYGGTPAELPENYESHSALANSDKLTMPVYIAHGSLDELIPVSQMRLLCGKLSESPQFVYLEIPDGNHDSPLHRIDSFSWALDKARL